MEFFIHRIIPVDWWENLVSDEEIENVTEKGDPAAHKDEICKVGEAFAPRFYGLLVQNDLGHFGACYCWS